MASRSCRSVWQLRNGNGLGQTQLATLDSIHHGGGGLGGHGLGLSNGARAYARDFGKLCGRFGRVCTECRGSVLVRTQRTPRINRCDSHGQLRLGHMAARLVLRHHKVARVGALRQLHHGALHPQRHAGAVAVPAVNHHAIQQGDGVLHADVLNRVLQLLEFFGRHGRKSRAQRVLGVGFGQCSGLARLLGLLKTGHGVLYLLGCALVFTMRFCASTLIAACAFCVSA